MGKARLKSTKANTKPCSSTSSSWDINLKQIRWLCPLGWLSATCMSLLAWLQSLYVALLGRCLMALVPLTSWNLYCNPAFTFTVVPMSSHSRLPSRPLHKDFCATHCLAQRLSEILNDTSMTPVLLHPSCL